MELMLKDVFFFSRPTRVLSRATYNVSSCWDAGDPVPAEQQEKMKGKRSWAQPDTKSHQLDFSRCTCRHIASTMQLMLTSCGSAVAMRHNSDAPNKCCAATKTTAQGHQQQQNPIRRRTHHWDRADPRRPRSRTTGRCSKQVMGMLQAWSNQSMCWQWRGQV